MASVGCMESRTGYIRRRLCPRLGCPTPAIRYGCEGRISSRIVFSASTKETRAATGGPKSGAWFTTAPMSWPLAPSPEMTILSSVECEEFCLTQGFEITARYHDAPGTRHQFVTQRTGSSIAFPSLSADT